MTLDSKVKAKLKELFGGAFSFKIKGDPTVAIVDFMRYCKAIPKGICTRHEAMSYFTDRVKWLLMRRDSKIRVVIVLADGEPTPVKKMVEHEKRYKDKKVFPSNGKRYFPVGPSDLIPTDWIQFAGNYKLLRRQLYPELFNAFIFCHYFAPKPGQMIVLSGFPGRSAYEMRFGRDRAWEARVDPKTGKMETVQQWEVNELPITPEMEKEDPDLYNRVYCVENVPPCHEYPSGTLRRFEWEAAKNDISEADIRMFWFDHWYQNEHILFVLNDGDVFSIGALYARERLLGIDAAGKYHFRNEHTVSIPYKKPAEKKGKGKGGKAEEEEAEEEEEEEVVDQQEADEKKDDAKEPKEEYVRLNKLFKLMREYYPMVSAGVQNPVLAMVFLIIITGTDFFPKQHMKGLGKINVVWQVFFDNIEIMQHLVQLTEGVPAETRTCRTLVVDEDLFTQFVRYCYLHKYEKTTIKKLKVDKLSLAQLKQRTQVDAKGRPKEDKTYHLPEPNEIRLWCRQIEWNLRYWKNGPLGHLPDPFEMWHGIPYYPYWKDEQGNYKLIDVVASRPKPVDDVYNQHLYRTRVLKKRPRVEDDAEISHRQRAMVDAFAPQVVAASK